jgi:hypothetical protein
MEAGYPIGNQNPDHQAQVQSSTRNLVAAPDTSEDFLDEGTPQPIDLPSPDICVICLDLLYSSPSTHATSDDEHNENSEAKKVDYSEASANPAALAKALPCQHDQFHFPCLGTWLTHSRFCPLCKVLVTAIALRHDEGVATDSGVQGEVIPLPLDLNTETRAAADLRSSDAHRRSTLSGQDRRRSVRSRTAPKSHVQDAIAADPVLRFRRTLYERQIPSLYRGRGVTRSPPAPPTDASTASLNNATIRTAAARMSSLAGSQPKAHPPSPRSPKTHHKRPIRVVQVTPSSFHPSNPDSTRLLRLAKIWIRRELSLFPFLNPTTPNSTGTSSTEYHHPPRRRPTTAPFLTNYILAILTELDLSGSGSSFEAHTLLGEYLGALEARLFVHELKAFLNSGCDTVRQWDEEVAMYWFEDEGELRDGSGRVLGRV